MNSRCAHCGAAITDRTGYTQVGDGDPTFPAGALLCMSRKCIPGSQRPAPGVHQANTPAVR